jgi:arylsulfatase
VVRDPRTTDEAFWPSSPAAQAAHVPFMRVLEGRKGEASRELEVYDLEQRRLIDAEITRRTIAFMRRSVEAEKPFYAYVPFTLLHFPTLPNPAFAGVTGHGDFADAITEMDAHVGEIVDAIDALGNRDDTSSCSRATTAGGDVALAGLVGPWRGYYFTTWKARCACRSSSAGRDEFRPDG